MREYYNGFHRFAFQDPKAEAISKATIHWIRELGLVGDAGGLQRLRPSLAQELLQQADEEMNKGWEICSEWMNDRAISEARHLTYCAYAAKMGWVTDRPLSIFDRSYLLE